MRHHKGITLVELLVIVAIVAIMAALVASRLGTATQVKGTVVNIETGWVDEDGTTTYVTVRKDDGQLECFSLGWGIKLEMNTSYVFNVYGTASPPVSYRHISSIAD